MKTGDDLTRDLAQAFPSGPGHLSRLHGRLATQHKPKASSTAPTAPSTALSAPCCSPPPTSDLSGSPTSARTTTPFCGRWASGSARVSSTLPPAWTPSYGRSRSTSRAAGTASTSRWTGDCRTGSGRSCCGTCPRSATGTPPATPWWRGWPAAPGPSAPWAPRVRPNPLPVVVPCHRVVRSDGRMGGYLGGVGAKRTLLTLEAA